MKVTVDLVQWVYEHGEWQTKIGTPAIRITGTQDYLVTCETSSGSFTVRKADLRAALNAIDQEKR